MLIFYIYNLVQLVGLTLLAPFLFVKAILTPRYSGRMLRRLGKGLDRDLAGFPTGRPRIWIHALSVGETASARSMIKELRQRYHFFRHHQVRGSVLPANPGRLGGYICTFSL